MTGPASPLSSSVISITVVLPFTYGWTKKVCPLSTVTISSAIHRASRLEFFEDDEPDFSDDYDYIPSNHAQNHQRPEPTAPSPVQESCDAAAFLVSWLWRANGVTTEEDGVNDPQTIINEEFTSDKREFVEKWCQETDLGRE